MEVQKQQKIGNLLQIKSQESSFSYKNLQLTHRTKIQVLNLLKPSTKLTVINCFYKQEDTGIITKITQIQLANKLIKISDSVLLQEGKKRPVPIEISGKPCREIIRVNRPLLSRKKTRILGKRPYRIIKKARDTKNAVKNVINLFISWLETESLIFQDIQDQTNQLKKGKKFNNSLIIQISQSEAMRRVFIQFAQDKGQQLIRNSRIRDKQSHAQALRKYESICRLAEANAGVSKQPMWETSYTPQILEGISL